jgi:hypothetical protein
MQTKPKNINLMINLGFSRWNLWLSLDHELKFSYDWFKIGIGGE